MSAPNRFAAPLGRTQAIRRRLITRTLTTAPDVLAAVGELADLCERAGASRSRVVRAKLGSLRVWAETLAHPAVSRRFGGASVIRARIVRELDTLALRLAAEPAGWRAGIARPRGQSIHRSAMPPAE